MIALLPIPGIIANKIQQAQAQRMKLVSSRHPLYFSKNSSLSLFKTDARIQAVTEAMNIIRMVKLFGWENRMSERLKEKREEELKLLWRIKLLNCASAMVG
jgi:ABC-type multidrug transport system fused ATPase/permease subunit